MRTPNHYKKLLIIVIALMLNIGSAYSQLTIVWNDDLVPPRARDAFANNSEHAEATYPQPCGTAGMPCAMNVGVRVCLTVEDAGGGTVTDIVWSFSGTATTISDYRIKSKRDYLEGFVNECSTIPLSESVLQNQHLICFYYTGTGTGTSKVTVTADVNGTPASAAAINFDVERDPKAETYYVTGDGFDSPVNWTPLIGANIPGVDRDNILGTHHLWDEEIQFLNTADGDPVTTLPGESFRFHRYYIQAFSCWRSIFGYPCLEPYIAAQGLNNLPTGPGVEGVDHSGQRCTTPDCNLLDGSGDGIVELQRTTIFHHRIEKMPKRFSICGGATTTYSSCCHLNLVPDPGGTPCIDTPGSELAPETPTLDGTPCTAFASGCKGFGQDGLDGINDCDYYMEGNNRETTLADFANENDLAANIVQWHNRMHDNVCHVGDFTNEWTTPADPFFFLYHSTLQRVYQLWQFLKLNDGTLTIIVDATSPTGAVVHYPDPDFTGFTEFEAGNCSGPPDEIFTLISGLASGSFFPNGTTTITGTIQDVVFLDPDFNPDYQGPGCMTDVTFNVVVNPRPRFEYAAKIVCGEQKNSNNLRLARGLYATTVNIHNPNDSAALFYKKLALTYPNEEQRAGEIIPLGVDTLSYDQALKLDCIEIKKRFKFPAYIEGFVIIQSMVSLDVSAVYTTARPKRFLFWSSYEVASIDVEQIRERVKDEEVELPDLIPVPDSLGFCIRRDLKLIVTVKNQGGSPSTPSTTKVDFFSHGDFSLPTPTLAPGAFTELLFDIPIGCHDPDCEFRITVDVNGVVPETNEGNNSAEDSCIG